MTKPMIYAYRRISSLKQSLGAGLEMQREEEVVQTLAKTLNLPISDAVMDDVGLSAFHGDHVKRGSLGWFLAAVEDGLIAKGSCLVIYTLDRFSRQQIASALSDLTAILKRGVMIYSILEDRLFGDPCRSNDEATMDITVASMVLNRSHNESLTKAKRTKKLVTVAINKHLEGQRSPDGYSYSIKVAGNDVWWVDNSDGIVKPHKKYFSLAREICLKRIDGWSVYKICRWLNNSDIPCPIKRSDKKRAGEWSRHLIDRLGKPNNSKDGKNQARPLLGEKIIQGVVLKDYYPAVLTEHEYYLLQDMLKNRQRPKSRSTQGESLFSSINVLCGHCGSPVTRTMETGNILNYRCGQAYCQHNWSKRGLLLEEAIVTVAMDKVWNPQEIRKEENRIPALKAELSEVSRKLSNITQEAMELGSLRAYQDVIRKLEIQEDELKAKIEEEEVKEAAKQFRETENIADRWSKATKDVLDFSNDIGRIRMRELIRDSFEYIKISRPEGGGRFDLFIHMRFIDGTSRFISLGRQEITWISGTDNNGKLSEKALKRLGKIGANCNLYQKDEATDQWLEDTYSEFTMARCKTDRLLW